MSKKIYLDLLEKVYREPCLERNNITNPCQKCKWGQQSICRKYTAYIKLKEFLLNNLQNVSSIEDYLKLKGYTDINKIRFFDPVIDRNVVSYCCKEKTILINIIEEEEK